MPSATTFASDERANVGLHMFTIRAPIQFASWSFNAGGQFQVELQGLAGKTYIFQASTNLTSWIPIRRSGKFQVEMMPMSPRGRR